MHENLRSLIGSDAYERYGLLIGWLLVESVMWGLHSLWTAFQSPKVGLVLSIILYFYVRWKIFLSTVVLKFGNGRIENIAAAVPYIWTFYLLQVVQMVEVYVLQPWDIYNNSSYTAPPANSFGKGLLGWLPMLMFLFAKLFYLASKVQCLRYAYQAQFSSQKTSE